MIESMAPRLAVYVLGECFNCRYALATAAAIRDHYPHVEVEVIDLATATPPDCVFATPTYLLDGRVWSLGNPSSQQIESTFGAAALTSTMSKG